MTNTSLGERTLRGILWTFGGNAFRFVVQIGVLAALARLLNPSDFGLVGAALIVIRFSDFFSEMGVGPALVRKQDLQPGMVGQAFFISTALGLLLAILLILLAPWVSAFFRLPELTSILRVLAIVFPLRSLTVIAESLLLRDFRFRKIAALNTICYVLGYGIPALLLAFRGAGAWALVVGQLTETLLRAVLYTLAKRHSIRFVFDLDSLRELLRFGGGFTMNRIANHVALQGDNAVVGRMLGADALGVYGRAYQIVVSPATLVGQAIHRVLFPALSKIVGETDALRQAYARSIQLMTLLLLPSSVLLFQFSNELVRILLGDQWIQAIPVVRVLSLGLFFRATAKISVSLSKAVGTVYGLAWRQWIYASLVVGGAVVAAPHGIRGVAYAVFGALAAHYILQLHLAAANTGLRFWDVVRLHARGIVWALALFPISGAIRQVGLGLGWHELAVLSVGVLVLGTGTLVVVSVWPRQLLGESGMWFLGQLKLLLKGRSSGSEQDRKKNGARP